MTWQNAYAVDGGTLTGPLLRQQLKSSTRSNEGVIEAGDLVVTELDVPGTSVQVAAGACVVLGREVPWQGSYYGSNVGVDTIDVAATDSGGPRSDLVVVRVEDPTISGSPWGHDPAADPLIYTRIITGVAPGTTALPDGEGSALVLARIDLPASTATITQDLITDLRAVSDPRSERVLRMQAGAPLPGGGWDKAGDYTGDFERWPQNAWGVFVPEWATQAQIIGSWDQVFYEAPGGTGGTYDARGQVRIGLIGSGGAGNVFTEPSAYNTNPITETNGYRTWIANRREVDIPPQMRGTTVSVRMYAKGDEGQSGRLVADDWASFSIDIQFNEVAAPGAAP